MKNLSYVIGVTSGSHLIIYISLSRSRVHSFARPVKLLLDSAMSVMLQCPEALKPSLSVLLAALTYTIVWPLIIVRIALAIGIMRIASSLPIIKDEIRRYNEKFLLVPYENFWHSWCSLKMLREVVRISLADLHRMARRGSPAPNCKLVSTDGKECRLLDLARGNRPLVLNFGSCS